MDVLNKVKQLIETEERERAEMEGEHFVSRIRHRIARELQKEMPEENADWLLKNVLVRIQPQVSITGHTVVVVSLPCDLDHVLANKRSKDNG